MSLNLNITKTLGSFTLRMNLNAENEVLGILGASGSGKSLLLKSIAGIVQPDSGFIHINNEEVFNAERKVTVPSRERHVGMLFQQYALFPHMTVYENIGFGLEHLPKMLRHDRIMTLIDQYHIRGLENRFPSQLSGGQQQRTALARAMAVQPEILLLDEPFSALDEHLRSQLISDLKETLNRFDGTVLLVTHNREEAYQLCENVAVLNSGEVEAIVHKDVLFSRPPTLACAQITGCKNISKIRSRRIDLESNKIILEAEDWTTTLELENISCQEYTSVDRNEFNCVNDNHDGNISVTADLFVGIQSNALQIATEAQQKNVVYGWLVEEKRMLNMTTLIFSIGNYESVVGDAMLSWDLPHVEADVIKLMTMPISIFLNPKSLFLIKNS